MVLKQLIFIQNNFGEQENLPCSFNALRQSDIIYKAQCSGVNIVKIECFMIRFALFMMLCLFI